MSDRGGGGAAQSNSSAANLDGAFLLQLLRRPQQSQPSPSPPQPQPYRDPAVAAVGPSYAFPPHSFLAPPRPPLQEAHNQFTPPPFYGRGPYPPPGFLLPSAEYRARPPHDRRGDPGYHPPRDNPAPQSPHHGFPNGRGGGGAPPHNLRPDSRRGEEFGGGREGERPRSGPPGPWRHESFPRPMMTEQRRPGSTYRVQKGPVEWVPSKGRQAGGTGAERANFRPSPSYSETDGSRGGTVGHHGSNGVGYREVRVEYQVEQPRDFARSIVHLIEGTDSEDQLNDSASKDGSASRNDASEEQDGFAEQLVDSLVLKDDLADKTIKRHSSRDKDLRSDSFRGHQVLSQRMRIRRRELVCRFDVKTFTPSFLSIYESLIPADEEKAKQKQLLLLLQELVTKEWPNAQLHVYGSCANSFGVSNSDIDICLAISDCNLSKPDILLKLADLLQEAKLENVQALTHARVPIVKLMDPITGISCDICCNNLLAVVNTKLLRDYAEIDTRLCQLAFIVKHWAKSRGVNETYRGTLSSYAYVLMCINFLQLRNPPILPCLQEMEATYRATVDETECAYFDQVDKLRDFGAHNKENISQLLWAFFQYWAYRHDYTNDVISVRTGRIISKRMKEWTRRIGNDRHLICIEDPFETSHDLGRVVDKFSIKILREEFERAADILQNDPNPNVTLFEPYVPGSTQG